jgi:hypothetical protein
MRKRAPHHLLCLLTVGLLSMAAVAASAAAADLPPNLVVDVRLFEARSTRPDFEAMENLSFFVATDGAGVTDPQWLGTIARQVPDAIIATLAKESVEPQGTLAAFDVTKRSRRFHVSVDLAEFLDRGTFAAKSDVTLLRADKALREFNRDIELRVGQTYVWSSRNLEVSASEYLSHFRDFEDTADRGRLYEKLRDFTFFLLVAVTPHLAEEKSTTPPVSLPAKGIQISDLMSPLGVPIEGEVELLLTLDDAGTPIDVAILRSSIPEVNPQVVGEAASWRFPEAAGQQGFLKLTLEAKP